MDTINKNFEQKLLSNRTLLVVTLTMNLRIDPRIVLIIAAPHMLFPFDIKEVVANVA